MHYNQLLDQIPRFLRLKIPASNTTLYTQLRFSLVSKGLCLLSRLSQRTKQMPRCGVGHLTPTQEKESPSYNKSLLTFLKQQRRVSHKLPLSYCGAAHKYKHYRWRRRHENQHP